MSNLKKKLKLVLTDRKVIFKNFQSPGDLLMLSAAIRDLKLSHKNIFIDVRTPCPAIWENNPYLTKLNDKDEDVEIYNAEYPLVHESNEGQYHFIHGFRKWMEDTLDLRIKATKFKGDIHISDEEKGWISQIEEMGIKDKFWIINSGIKFDFTAKAWNPHYYQEVVDHFLGDITFVQVGQKEHWHPPLNNVINLVGKTDLRQLIRLVYHSIGTIGGVSLLMHLGTAIESKHGLLSRPGICIAGGREPSVWESYTNQQFLHTCGCLPCCDMGGCWCSRASQVNDGDKKDLEENLCLNRVKTTHKIKDNNLYVPKCMDMIKPQSVINAIKLYYEGGGLE